MYSNFQFCGPFCFRPQRTSRRGSERTVLRTVLLQAANVLSARSHPFFILSTSAMSNANDVICVSTSCFLLRSKKSLLIPFHLRACDKQAKNQRVLKTFHYPCIAIFNFADRFASGLSGQAADAPSRPSCGEVCGPFCFRPQRTSRRCSERTVLRGVLRTVLLQASADEPPPSGPFCWEVCGPFCFERPSEGAPPAARPPFVGSFACRFAA